MHTVFRQPGHRAHFSTEIEITHKKKSYMHKKKSYMHTLYV